MSFRPDFKDAPRLVDTSAGWQKVEAEGRCRACGKPLLTVRQGAPEFLSLNRAHLVSRGQRGDDVANNIIGLGGSGTTGCHGIQTSRNPGPNCHGVTVTYEEVASAIRRSLTPAERQYVIAKKSRAWLDKHYPSPRSTRSDFTIRVPDDEQENGAQVLAALIDGHRRRLAPVLGFEDSTPDYYVLAAVLAAPA